MMRNTQIIKRANCVLVLFWFAFLLLFFYRILLGKKPNPTPQSNRMLTSDCGGRNQYQTASWVYNKPKSSASFIILSHRLLGDELKVPNEATKKPTQTPTQMKEIDGWIVLSASGVVSSNAALSQRGTASFDQPRCTRQLKRATAHSNFLSAFPAVVRCANDTARWHLPDAASDRARVFGPPCHPKGAVWATGRSNSSGFGFYYAYK